MNLKRWNKTLVYTIDILEMANFLEANGRKGAVIRWSDIKKHSTDHGYIMKQGFAFEFDYDYQKNHEDLDEETLNDMLFIQEKLDVPDKSVLFLEVKSDFILRNELEIIENYLLKPKVENMFFINVIYVMDDLDKKRSGFKERWRQVIGWYSNNFSNYSLIYYNFDIEEFKKQPQYFQLDAELFKQEYGLNDKEKILFEVNW